MSDESLHAGPTTNRQPHAIRHVGGISPTPTRKVGSSAFVHAPDLHFGFIQGHQRKRRKEKNILTLEQVSEHLNVHPATVKSWCADGSLIAVNTSKNANSKRRRLMVEEKSLDQFITLRRIMTATPSLPKGRRRTTVVEQNPRQRRYEE